MSQLECLLLLKPYPTSVEIQIFVSVEKMLLHSLKGKYLFWAPNRPFSRLVLLFRISPPLWGLFSEAAPYGIVDKSCTKLEFPFYIVSSIYKNILKSIQYFTAPGTPSNFNMTNIPQYFRPVKDIRFVWSQQYLSFDLTDRIFGISVLMEAPYFY